MADKNIPSKLHPSLIDSFVPLPSNVEEKLTTEQLNSVFTNQDAWREVIQRTMQQKGIEPLPKSAKQ